MTSLRGYLLNSCRGKYVENERVGERIDPCGIPLLIGALSVFLSFDYLKNGKLNEAETWHCIIRDCRMCSVALESIWMSGFQICYSLGKRLAAVATARC